MLDFFYNFFYFYISASTLILIHEFGHFLVAKKLSISVKKFSVGLGYSILKWYDKELTRYQISIFPFGGYVEIFEEKDKENYEKRKIVTSCKRIAWKRIIIVLSGSIFNIFFSILVFWLIFSVKPCYKPVIKNVIPNSIAEKIGILPGMIIKSIDKQLILDWDTFRLYLLKSINKKEISIDVNILKNGKKECKNIILLNDILKSCKKNDLVYELGIIPMFPKKDFFIKKIDKNSLDLLSKLKVGDKLIKFNGKNLYEWTQVLKEISNNLNKSCVIDISRNNKIYKINFCLKKNFSMIGKKENNILGFQIEEIFTAKDRYLIQKLNILESLNYSLKRSWYLICIIKNFLINYPKELISSIRGPIFIGESARKSINHGITSYFIFLSTLSINMGIINLLPLPILDGGNLLLIFARAMIKDLNLKNI